MLWLIETCQNKVSADQFNVFPDNGTTNALAVNGYFQDG